MQASEPRQRIHSVFTLSGLCLAVLITGVWAAQELPVAKDGPAKLGGIERYRTHVSTNKPIYRGGETVYVRAVVLDAVTNRPLPANAVAAAEIEIVGPKGDTIARGSLTSENAVLGFGWLVPDEQPGGEYTIKVAYPWQGYAPAQRKFDIRQYRAPRLKTQIVFVRDGYGPGDTVSASVNITRAEGGVPDGAKITAVARVDGKEVHRGQVEIDAEGNASAAFKLPAKIERGEGTLAFVIEDGGVVETAAKTIPILLQTVNLGIYPESGDLVAGIASRVYIEVKTPWGKPADIQAVIEDIGMPNEDRAPMTMAHVVTFHEGRGHFTFTPEADHDYRLRISKPAGMVKTYPLPKVKAKGAVLRAIKDVYLAGEPITMDMGRSGVTPSKLVISKAGQSIGEADAAVASDSGVVYRRVSAKLPEDIAGVLVATLYGADGAPLAERLVYRKPARQVNIEIKMTKTRYTPGDPVELNIRTTDSQDQPIGAVVGLSVTDDSVLEMIDKREQAPRLPVMVLLGSDVRDLADAHVYLDPDNDKAAPAIDLLLGTQGWRRFASVDVDKFLKTWGDDARRALALRLPDPRRAHDILTTDNGRLDWDKDVNGRLIYLSDQKPVAKGAVLHAIDGRAIRERNMMLDEQDEGVIVDSMTVTAVAGATARQSNAEPQPAMMKPADQPFRLERNLKDNAFDVALGKIVANRSPRPSQRNDFILVREYAHEVRPDRQPGQRIDFAETLYFHAGVATDSESGTATVKFGLSDAVTSFRVSADGFDADGALGSQSTLIESVQPFYIEPKMPLELTSGDVVNLPIALVNATDLSLDDVTVEIKTNDAISVTAPAASALAAGARVRQIVSVNTGSYVGSTPFVLDAAAGTLTDRNTRTLVVKPLGFPSGIAFGGIVEAGQPVSLTINVPKDYVPKSMSTDIRVFPSPVANMTTAMERLICEPHGCFEQTSSTNYPLAMAQQYFTTHQGVDPVLIDRSAKMLAKGYEKLTSFECRERGYEWFGQDPGHEALTAYGLMEFVDMARTMQVDQEMVDFTRTWLMKQRDGEGNFKRGRRALHTWIVDQDCSNGYILWALLSTGTDAETLTKEIDAYEQSATKSDNSYVTALGALVMSEAGRDASAAKLRQKLAKQQSDDGCIAGATTSIVGSTGTSLNVETTALAQLAMLEDSTYAGHVEAAHKWLAEQCEGGRYGSTQSTVLAIKAIVAYNESRATPRAPGKIKLAIDGQPVGKPIAFGTDDKQPFILPDITDRLTPGEHTIELTMEDGSAMPFSFAVDYNRTQPDSSDECKLRLSTSLKDATLSEGNITEARVKVTNITSETVPTPIAIIGIPGGLEVRHDQLKELRDAGTIASYEVIGREVVLYWRELKAKQTLELPLSLVAAVPGKFTGPASRAYLYYGDEHKQWTNPLTVTVTAK